MITHFETAADFRKSLETRLKNIAMAKSENLQRLRKKVAFDRLLARLFSTEQHNFFLKGGYAMELRLKTARATKDIDLTSIHRKHGNDSLNILILEELRYLALKDLGDFFIFNIGNPEMDLDNAPYGGARYPVTSLLDGRLFVRFQLDVGADAIVTQVENLQGPNWLEYCGIPSPTFTIISVEQQFAEKLHAYTLPRSQRRNTRVKDLIDMVLLIKMRTIDLKSLKKALTLVFKIRATHSLPSLLEAPPSEWEIPFNGLAKECTLFMSISEAFSEISRIYSEIQSLNFHLL